MRADLARELAAAVVHAAAARSDREDALAAWALGGIYAPPPSCRHGQHGTGKVREASCEPAERPAMRRVTDRERFLTFALAAAEMLAEVTLAGRIVFAAGAFRSRLGQPPEHWVGRAARDLFALPDRDGFDRALSLLLARDRLPPTQFRLADAATTPVTVGGLRLVGEAEPRLCLTIAPTAAPAARAAGVGTAASLRAAIEGEARSGNEAGTLGLLELRNREGPLAGLDSLIRADLQARLGPHGLAGDLGAGRYGLVCPTPDAVAAIAGGIEATLAEAGHSVDMTSCSLHLDPGALTPMQATRALRHALSTFTRGGAGALSAAGFDTGLSGFVANAYSRAAWLRQAIAERRFTLAFQPIVALADREPQHFEALLRPAMDPGAPLRGPQDFVTFAETIGLSEDLDWAVLDTICGAARLGRGARIAANVSGFSLQSPEFRARLLQLLDQEPVLVRRLLIEITETAEIEDEAEAVATVEALRARGLPLCIDDFGAGAAAFRYLRTFRVDYVKIDGLYVTNAMEGGKDRAIVASMVDLAHTMGAKVVAEHIETEAEAALMQTLGVDLGQGWLFGRPGPLPVG